MPQSAIFLEKTFFDMGKTLREINNRIKNWSIPQEMKWYVQKRIRWAKLASVAKKLYHFQWFTPKNEILAIDLKGVNFFYSEKIMFMDIVTISMQ